MHAHRHRHTCMHESMACGISKLLPNILLLGDEAHRGSRDFLGTCCSTFLNPLGKAREASQHRQESKLLVVGVQKIENPEDQKLEFGQA